MTLGHTFRGILFDKDGTLIDLHSSWVNAGVSTLDELCARAGAPQLRDTLLLEGGYDPRTGSLGADSVWAAGTTESLVARWIERLGLDASMMPEMLAFMTDRAAARVLPLTDVCALLDEVEALDMAVGVATMDLARSAHRCLEGLGISHRVDFVCGCDSGHGHKPGPGMALAFCERMGLAPGEILVVGDTPHDMHMGRAAGAAAVVGVLSGAASESALRPLADRLIADVSQLPPLLR